MSCQACLQRCNFRELEANDPDWSKVVLNRNQWLWLQPNKRAYEFAAKAVNASDESNFVPANLFIYIQLDGGSEEFLVAMPIHQSENVQFVQIPKSNTIFDVVGMVSHSLLALINLPLDGNLRVSWTPMLIKTKLEDAEALDLRERQR